MTVTRDDALTAAWRAASRCLRDLGIEEDHFDGFLVNIEELLPAVRDSMSRWSIACEGDDEELKKITANYAYHNVIQLAVGSMLLLGHFPALDQIARALPMGDATDG